MAGLKGLNLNTLADVLTRLEYSSEGCIWRKTPEV